MNFTVGEPHFARMGRLERYHSLTENWVSVDTGGYFFQFFYRNITKQPLPGQLIKM